MSRALRLAKERAQKSEKGLPDDFTPQECDLFMKVSTFLDAEKRGKKGPYAGFGKFSDFEAVAARLDQGGVLNPPFVEMMGFSNMLAKAKRHIEEQKNAFKARLESRAYFSTAATQCWSVPLLCLRMLNAQSTKEGERDKV